MCSNWYFRARVLFMEVINTFDVWFIEICFAKKFGTSSCIKCVMHKNFPLVKKRRFYKLDNSKK